MFRNIDFLRRVGLAAASVLLSVIVVQPAFSQAGVGSVITAEPTYTASTYNSITFDPSAIPGADVYEVCFFDSANLITQACIDLSGGKSQGSAATLDVVFEDLDSGHKYGYYVQAHFIAADSVVYSDTTFSVQDATPPGQVVDATIDNQPGGIVVIDWTGVDDLVSSMSQYYIYRKLAGQPYSLIDSVTPGAPAAAHSFTESLGGGTGLVEGASQLYQIRSTDIVGNGINSSNIGPVAPDATMPDVPTLTIENAYRDANDTAYVAGVRVPVTGRSNGVGAARADSIQFEWARDSVESFIAPVQLGSDFDSSGWMRYRSDSVFWDTTLLPSPDFDDPDYVHNHYYFFRARAKDTTNNVSAWSDTVGVYMDAHPPGDIANLIVTPKNDVVGVACIVEVQWDAAVDTGSGVAQYYIYRSIDSVIWNLIGSVDDLVTIFEDSCENINERTTVWYKVLSCDNVGNCRTGTGWAPSTKPPMPPKTAASCDTTVNGLCFVKNYTVLRWGGYDTSGVIKYTIDVNGAQEELIGPDHFDDTSWFNVDTVYTLRVRSHFADGNVSIWSDAQHVRHDGTAPNQVDSFTVALDETCAGNIYLSWFKPWDAEAASDVVRYNIYRMLPSDTGFVLHDFTLANDNDNYPNDGTIYTDEYADPFDDTLIAFQWYLYKVLPIDMMGWENNSQFKIDSAYCTHPPVIDSAETSGDRITIRWQRVSPNKATTWYDSVRVFKNSTDNLFQTVELFGAPTEFSMTSLTVNDSGNYIFQVKEMPLSDSGLVGMASAWSCPVVVPYDNRPDPVASLIVQPQPILPEDTSTSAARIFLSWHYNDSALVESFIVTRRTTGLSDVSFVVPSIGGADGFYMDGSLNHATTYQYGLSIIDSLGQNSDTTWSSGRVEPIWMFTPAVALFEPVFFDSDTLIVSWRWFDPLMSPAVGNPYGADSCRVQISIDPLFSQFQPSVLGPWADANSGSVEIDGMRDLADFLGGADKYLYFRIQSVDQWGNPSFWSSQYDFPAVRALLDDRAPNACTSLLIDSTEAHPSASDRAINVYLNWDAVADNGGAGVMSYNVYRTNPDAPSILVATVGYPTTEYMDDSVDVLNVGNCEYSYWVQTVDSLSNEQAVGNNTVCLDLLTAPEIDFVDATTICWTNADPVAADFYYAEIGLDPSWLGTPVVDSIGHTALIPGDSVCWTFVTNFDADATVYYHIKLLRDDLESSWSDIASYSPIPTDVDDPGDNGSLPKRFALYPNYPNPFNPETQIAFDLPRRSHVVLKVFNIKGELVRTLVNGSVTAGHHTVTWSGANRSGQSVASGVYIYQFKADEKLISRKMVLLR